MPIELKKTEVKNSQGFPADEDGVFPNKSTINMIIGLTLLIVAATVVFALSMNHSGTKLNVPIPTSQQQSMPAAVEPAPAK